jgi:hypothetical protein
VIDKTCDVCGATFAVQPYRRESARFCSRRCGGMWHASTRLARAPKPWAVGNRWRAGKRPTNAWQAGARPWNKGIKGIRLSPTTEFAPGGTPASKVDVGTVRVRTDKNGRPRAWVKTADPSTWRPRAVVAWEAAHGPLPSGRVIHHIDRDSLNDEPSNLAAMTRAQHIREHQAELAVERLRAEEAGSTVSAQRAGQLALLGGA